MENKLNITQNDFNSICRLCLNRDSQLKPIYLKSETSTINQFPGTSSMDKVIETCLGLNVQRNDSLPNSICLKCSQKLHDNYSFRQQSRASDEFLRSVVITEDKINFSLNNKSAKKCRVKLKKLPNDKCDEIKTENLSKPEVEQSIYSDFPNELNKKMKAVSPRKSKKRSSKSEGKPPIAKLSAQQKYENELKRKSGICTVCGVYAKHVKRHARIHDTTNQVQCDYCNKLFSDKHYLVQYHFKIHLNLRPFHCTLCEYKFAGKAQLAKHMQTHAGDKPYKCEICAKTFGHLSSKIYHEKTHMQDRKIICSQCNKCFLTKKCLQRHMRVHTDMADRPFKCDLCDLSYFAPYLLSRHRLKIHQIVSSHQCDICLAMFNDRSMLRSHLRDHGINDITNGPKNGIILNQ